MRRSAAWLAAAVGQGGPGPLRALRSTVFPVDRPPTPRPPRCFLRLPRTRGGATSPPPQSGHSSRGPHRGGPRAVSTRPADARGGLLEDLTSPRGLAPLRLRSSRLQGHFSASGVRPARLGGRAPQPANLRQGRSRERGRSGHGRAGPAHPSPDC